jgi:hypothetical protein
MTLYKSGHLVYINHPSPLQFRNDASPFMEEALKSRVVPAAAPQGWLSVATALCRRADTPPAVRLEVVRYAQSTPTQRYYRIGATLLSCRTSNTEALQFIVLNRARNFLNSLPAASGWHDPVHAQILDDLTVVIECVSWGKGGQEQTSSRRLVIPDDRLDKVRLV